MSVRREWHGKEVELRGKRATGRAAVGIAEQISAQAKGIVHVMSGDLRRSIHAAVPNSMGERTATPGSVSHARGATVEVGSWLPYACVEETGRGHLYMQPAFEMIMSGPAMATIQAAFAEEGF